MKTKKFCNVYIIYSSKTKFKLYNNMILFDAVHSCNNKRIIIICHYLIKLIRTINPNRLLFITTTECVDLLSRHIYKGSIFGTESKSLQK